MVYYELVINIFDFKVYLMGCFFFLLVKVDNLILYWCFIFCFVGKINLWMFGVNFMSFWLIFGNILYLRMWLQEVFLEFFGGFYVNLIILGVLIIFFMFGFVFKLMYNEDYSSFGKKKFVFY